MPNALFAFEDRDDARRAIQRLIDRDMPPAALRLHAHEHGNDSFAREADEQVTGGLLTNLLELFQGVFDWGDSPHDASMFADAVRRGGAVVEVNAADDAQCALADEAMHAEGCSERTGWRSAPTTR